MVITSRTRRSTLAALAVLLGACWVEVPQEVREGVVVATRRDPAADFAAFSTFLVNPTIAIVLNGEPVPGPIPHQAEIVAAVAANLEARGYVAYGGTWLPGTGAGAPPPELHLGVQITAVLSDVQVYIPGDYCDPLYWDGCWGWSWGGMVSYQAGTLAIELLDLKDGATGGAYQAIWAALDHGILVAYPSFDLQRLLEGIDRAFAQSPYLSAGPG